MNKLRKITAWLTVIVIIGLVVATFICGITGSEYFFGMLFLALVVPLVLWVFMWFTRLVNKEPKDGEISLPDESTKSDQV